MGDKKQNLEEIGGTTKKDEYCESMESSSISDSFTSSFSSLSSSVEDLTDDASSSSSSNSNSSTNSSGGPLYELAEPLYELAELMAQLPIKRGLSNFYHGRSQTFGSLASVRSVEDLAKKETTTYSERMKSCKSYGGNLNKHKYFGPKATITKRRRSFSPPLGAKPAID